MRVVVYRHRSAASNPWLDALASGIGRHGVRVDRADYGSEVGTPDVAVLYGIGQQKVIDRLQAQGTRCLIMEMGYVGDRYKYQSLLFGGLNGRGIHPPAPDGGKRWRRLFGDEIKPWRHGGDYVLIVGQWHKDQSVRHLNCDAWYAKAVREAAREYGLPIVFRPHPLSDRRGHSPPTMPGARVQRGPEADALQGAALVVTLNSNFGVLAALAGVPVVAVDDGAMAWPVAAHEIGENPIRPDRTAWAHELAFAQWTQAEMASGEAWDHLRDEVS